MTAEAGRLGWSCRHRRCRGWNGVPLGALLAATLLTLSLGRCGYCTVRGLSALLADAKNDNHTADDKDNSDTAANNKRQVSLDKVQHILGQGMGDIGLIDVHVKC